MVFFFISVLNVNKPRAGLSFIHTTAAMSFRPMYAASAPAHATRPTGSKLLPAHARKRDVEMQSSRAVTSLLIFNYMFSMGPAHSSACCNTSVVRVTLMTAATT
jgi:hypothetical protein